jgi:hypothetical protein
MKEIQTLFPDGRNRIVPLEGESTSIGRSRTAGLSFPDDAGRASTPSDAVSGRPAPRIGVERARGGAAVLVGLLNVVHEMQVVSAGEDHHLPGPGSAAVEVVHAGDGREDAVLGDDVERGRRAAASRNWGWRG